MISVVFAFCVTGGIVAAYFGGYRTGKEVGVHEEATRSWRMIHELIRENNRLMSENNELKKEKEKSYGKQQIH